MRAWTTQSVAETRQLGAALAEEVEPDGLVLLFGELGSGKTILTQGIASGLGIDPSEVQSPTFILMREHDGSLARLVHIDLYRLEPQEIERLGLDEVLSEPSVKVVEWADRFPQAPLADLTLELTRGERPGTRRICEKGAPLEPEGRAEGVRTDGEVDDD